jgi:hypothetical protein
MQPAFLLASFCSRASEEGVMDSPPRAVQRNSRGTQFTGHLPGNTLCGFDDFVKRYDRVDVSVHGFSRFGGLLLAEGGKSLRASALYSSICRVHCSASSRTFSGFSVARFFDSERSRRRS